MAKIYLVDSDTYVTASGFDQATEKYIEVRGKDPVTMSLFKDTEFVITESVVVDVTPGVLPALAEADGATTSPATPVFIKEGSSITLTAVPSAGYTTFVNWTVNSVEVSTANPFTYTATSSDVTIIANFTA